MDNLQIKNTEFQVIFLEKKWASKFGLKGVKHTVTVDG